MLVSEAVVARRSIRQFTGTPVPNGGIRDLLERAGRAPSGGNLQPWRVYVLNDDSMARFRSFIAERPSTSGECDIYPPKLWDPYRTNRFTNGEQLYATSESSVTTSRPACASSPATTTSSTRGGQTPSGQSDARKSAITGFTTSG